ncbi:MAG: DUF1559 domain-containing protein [Pirellulaceae bacterium]
MNNRFLRDRYGFTLIELLVVIAIIGILVGLLMPAVQQVREAARRTQCSNNQHNIAIAIENYHSALNRFPAMAEVADGFVDVPSPGNVAAPSWSWQVYILPYMEQQAVYELMNPTTQAAVDACGHAVQPQGASLLAAFQTPLFVCPSDDGPELNAERWLGPDVSIIVSPENMTVAKGNYVGSNIDYEATAFKNQYPSPEDRGGGVFSAINYHTKHRDLLDGSSSTLLIGERAWQYRAGGVQYHAFAANQLINRDTREYGSGHQPCGYFGIGDSDTCASVVGGQGINYPHTNPLAAKCSYSSRHPAGAVFAFADGSIHFLSSATDALVLKNLADRADGQVIPEFE